MTGYYPQSIVQWGGDIGFSLSRIPTAQAPSPNYRAKHHSKGGVKRPSTDGAAIPDFRFPDLPFRRRLRDDHVAHQTDDRRPNEIEHHPLPHHARNGYSTGAEHDDVGRGGHRQHERTTRAHGGGNHEQQRIGGHGHRCCTHDGHEQRRGRGVAGGLGQEGDAEANGEHDQVGCHVAEHCQCIAHGRRHARDLKSLGEGDACREQDERAPGNLLGRLPIKQASALAIGHDE